MRELARPSKHTARSCPFNTSVPVRLPPQKGLESSSGSRQQALGIAVRIPVRLPSTETSRKFSSRKQAARRRHRRRLNARKFFSNKVFLLGVAGSTQNRHSRHPCPFNTSVPMRVTPQKGLESSSGSRQQTLGIAVLIPVRLPSTETSRKFISKKVFHLRGSRQHAEGIVGVPMRVPRQKGLESSSQIKFFFLGWQAAHSIGIVGIPVPLILLPHAVRELSRPSKHTARPCPFNTSSACCQ